MRYLYSLTFYLLFPMILLRLWWKGLKVPAYRQRLKERLGFFPTLPEPGCIWIHAVSLGEMIIAIPIINALKKRYPHLKFLITTMTVTGSGLASKQVNDELSHVYVPYDLPGVVQRFLNRVQPRMLIIMETELWPNLLHYTASRKIPILLANARLSERSARGYRFIPALTRQMLLNINLIAAQTKEDAERFNRLGADSKRVAVVGNVKFDTPVPMELVEQGYALRRSWMGSRPTVIAASTHAGEEEKILKAFSELIKTFPEALLILVPRHPERFEEVALLCKKCGYSVVRRSENQPCNMETQVFLGDSLGELFLYYAASDVAFVGGSLVPIGGHNLLEPAALGLPIISGPHIFNFARISKLLQEADALVWVDDEKSLAKIWSELLSDEFRRTEMGKRGMGVLEGNRGALQRHLDSIAELLFSEGANRLD